MKLYKLFIFWVLLVIFSLNFFSGISYARSFSDVVANSEYGSAIMYLAEKNILMGYSDGSFKPENEINRAEFTKIVIEAAFPKESGGENCFRDVSSEWFAGYVCLAKEKNILTGYPDKTFRPERSINFAEASKIIANTFGLKIDEKYGKDWFEKYILALKNISAIPNSISNFDQKIKRGEMSFMIYKVLERKIEVDDSTQTTDTNDDVDTTDPVDIVDNPVVGDPVDPINPPIVVDPEPSVNLFDDDFSGYSAGNYNDGVAFGSWFAEFGGYGTVGIEADGSNKLLHLSPKVADSADKTHASLITGPLYQGPIKFQAKLLTVQQIRTDSTPNPWEVAWNVWNYTDNEHFYYFIPKTNGWELGKRDPDYAGGQRFLATGSDKVFPVGQWYDVKIEQDDSNVISVWVNGSKITSFTDVERPYSSGNIAFYTEDAHIHVDNVSVEY